MKEYAVPKERTTFRQDARIILDNLKKIVEKAGGRVKEHSPYFNYIRFVLNGYMYYFQIDDNPLFPHYYIKTKVVDGKYSLNTYMDELEERTWMKRLERYVRNTDECLEHVAEDLYETLLAAKESERYREEETKVVPNIYNSGTHTERVFKPERFAEVDF